MQVNQILGGKNNLYHKTKGQSLSHYCNPNLEEDFGEFKSAYDDFGDFKTYEYQTISSSHLNVKKTSLPICDIINSTKFNDFTSIDTNKLYINNQKDILNHLTNKPNYDVFQNEIPYPSFDIWRNILQLTSYYFKYIEQKLKNFIKQTTKSIDVLDFFPLKNYLNNLNKVYFVGQRISYAFKYLDIQNSIIEEHLDNLNANVESLNASISLLPKSTTVDCDNDKNYFKSFMMLNINPKFASILQPYCHLCILEESPIDSAVDDIEDWRLIHSSVNLLNDVQDSPKNTAQFYYHLTCLNFLHHLKQEGIKKILINE